MIDQTDLQIITCLKENARVNASDISDQVGMSVSAVIERIKKLEASGIITRYTAVLDHKKLGMDVTAFMSVSLEHPKFNDGFIGAVDANPQIVECTYITGDFDFMLKVVAYSTEDLAAILNTVKSIPGVSLTRTQLVLSTHKNEVSVLPRTCETGK